MARGVVVVARPRWIDTPLALADLLQRLEEAVDGGARVAVDTEFHSEHRYRPRLMLIQLAWSPEEAWLIDPLALPDLSRLGTLLSRAELIFHAPGQDLPILARRCGLSPSQLHDTQLMAGFCGLGHPVSLSDLCRDVLGVDLNKGSTLSDWKKRPLSEEQRDYAADDVRFLHALAEALQARIPVHHRDALLACTQERIEQALEPTPVDQAWRRFGVARVLTPASLRVLVALCSWREALGRELDQPTRQILSDGLLVDLARRRPTTLDALARNRRFSKKLVRDRGALLLELIAAADEGPTPELPPQDERTRARRACLDALVAVRALETGIANKLLLPLEDRDAALASVFHLGWRDKYLNPTLTQFKAGEFSIRLPE